MILQIIRFQYMLYLIIHRPNIQIQFPKLLKIHILEILHFFYIYIYNIFFNKYTLLYRQLNYF